MSSQIHTPDRTTARKRRLLPAFIASLLLLFSLDSFAAEQDSDSEARGSATTEETGEKESRGSGWKISGWNIQTSLYTKHWDPEPDHTNKQKLIGPELVFENDYLVGLAIFRNSFDQPSQFLYIGKTWRLFRSEYFYFKLVGGLLHGYKEPYEDKIPFNGLGVAPAILPSFGFRYKYIMLEAQIAGAAAITITGGLRF